MTSALNIALASSTPPKLLLDINTSYETILWRHCISCQLEVPCQQFELTISITEVTPSDFQTLADAKSHFQRRSIFSLLSHPCPSCGMWTGAALGKQSEPLQPFRGFSPSAFLGLEQPKWERQTLLCN